MLSHREGLEGKWLPLTKRELGSLINASTETCIRILSAWEKEGMITSARGRLQVTDLEGVRALVGQTS
jgi:CRP-like cAMP-binding protein